MRFDGNDTIGGEARDVIITLRGKAWHHDSWDLQGSMHGSCRSQS